MKAFISDAAPHFQNLEVKYVGGDPVISFFSEEGEVIEKVDISKMKKSEIVELVVGFGLLFTHESETAAPNTEL